VELRNAIPGPRRKRRRRQETCSQSETRWSRIGRDGFGRLVNFDVIPSPWELRRKLYFMIVFKRRSRIAAETAPHRARPSEEQHCLKAVGQAGTGAGCDERISAIRDQTQEATNEELHPPTRRFFRATRNCKARTGNETAKEELQSRMRN